jgi:DNA-directed RNA polymerase subunit RPC12/RpoP
MTFWQARHAPWNSRQTDDINHSEPMRCPRCNLKTAFNKDIFRGKFRCEQCGAKLVAAESYNRMLAIISILFGFGLPGLVHLPSLLISSFGTLFGFLVTLVLGFPLSFTVLFFAVRLIPLLLSPPLVVRNDSSITVLGLTAGQEDGPCDNSGN